MSILSLASVRHLLRHPAQLALALLGLTVGVGTIVAVDIATASSGRAFQLSMQAVNGTATHQIAGGPSGIDERLYVELRQKFGAVFAPVVEGYVTVGDRTFQLIGIDPFANPAAGITAARDLTRWFTQPGAVVMSATTAGQLGIGRDGSLRIDVGGKSHAAVLIDTLPADQAGYDALILTDIAQAQEWLECLGRLSRIDARLPDGSHSEADLRRFLPPGLRLAAAQGRTRQSLDMTAAFTTNLQAMSLLALLVSTLLIYGAISFAVVQRRRIIGILRALGATRREVLSIVLTEGAVLGVVGALLGVLLGVVIGHGLVSLVSRTINDLYFVVAVNETVLPPGSLLKALLVGLGTALAGALLPALEVAASSPQLGLRRSVLEERAVRLSRKLLYASGTLAICSGVLALVSGRSLLAGFVSLFMLLLSVAALTPAVLRSSARVSARLAGRKSPVARLALGDIAASLSRTGVAVAALGMAVAAMIGVSVMVGSFRESLREWLARTMRADIYVTAPGPGTGRPERRIDPDLIQRITSAQGVRDYGMSRRMTVDLPSGPIPLDAVQLARGGYANFALTASKGTPTDAAVAWRAFERGAVMISEPLAWRLQLSAGDVLRLPTDSGLRPFQIAGVYREYGNDRGAVMMSLPVYRAHWRDDSITALGLYVVPGASPARVIAEFRSIAQGRQALYIRSNAELRELSMSIFERTFIITRVLYWLAAGVAAIGLVSALLAWELERAREIGILRALGLTPGGAGLLIEAQTGFMGLVALVAAVPAGLLTALVLIAVVNRRAFGWQIDMHLSFEQFGNAFMLSLAAALAAGLYPSWRAARTQIAGDMREE